MQTEKKSQRRPSRQIATNSPAFGSLTTEAAAAMFGLKPNTLRVGFSKNGHYLGITPRKLPNGRLVWPGDAVSRLLSESSEGAGK